MDPTGSALFAPAPGTGGLSRSPRQARRHRFEIDALVTGGQLEIRWSYSRNQHTPAVAGALAAAFRQELLALVGHCAGPEAGGCTPSDFPLAALPAGALDQVVMELAARKGISVRETLREIDEITAVTPLQQEMLDCTRLAPASGVWLVQLNLGLEGHVDRTALAQAWQGLTDRHGILRSTFVPGPLGQAIRVVWRRARTPLQTEDWRGAPESGRRMTEFLHAERVRGFRLAEVPPVRLTLVRQSGTASRLILSFHHALLDGWSTSLLLSELFGHYGALVAGRPPRPQAGRPYSEYLAWLSRQDRQAAAEHWQQVLSGYCPPAPIGAGPASGPHMAGACREAALTPAVTRRLNATARRHGLTLSTLVQGAWALLLSGLTGQADLVWGTVMAGRPVELDGAGAIAGLLMGTVPVRAALAPAAPAAPWLAALQEQIAASARYSDMAPANPTIRPLFESAVFFENYPVDPSLREGRGGLALSDISFHEQHHYPLSLIAVPGDRLVLQVLTHLNRLSPAAAAALTQRLVDVLEVMSHSLDGPLAGLMEIAQPACQVPFALRLRTGSLLTAANRPW